MSPLIVQVSKDAATVHVPPLGEEVTTYEVTAEPPLTDGGFHEIVALPAPATALTEVGALGALAGVAGPDGVDDAPEPAAFVADALNVYVWPLINPEIVHEVAGEVTTHVAPPGDAVTV